MTDVTTGLMPIELTPRVPLEPEAIAELEAAPGQAVDGLAPVIDEGAAASTELPPALDDASSEVPSSDAHAALEIEHPIGPVRQGVLDHLLDSEGPQTVAQIIAGLGNWLRLGQDGRAWRNPKCRRWRDGANKCQSNSCTAAL